MQNAMQRRAATIALAIPFDAFPGCQRATDITDLWSHPAFGGKCEDVISSIKLLAPPSHMVFAGAHAPAHVQKGLAIVTFGAPARPAIPELVRWKDRFFGFRTGATIRVDVQFAHRREVYRRNQKDPGCSAARKGRVGSAMLESWQPQRRSTSPIASTLLRRLRGPLNGGTSGGLAIATP